jgi:hypothetical protein
MLKFEIALAKFPKKPEDCRRFFGVILTVGSNWPAVIFLIFAQNGKN